MTGATDVQTENELPTEEVEVRKLNPIEFVAYAEILKSLMANGKLDEARKLARIMKHAEMTTWSERKIEDTNHARSVPLYKAGEENYEYARGILDASLAALDIL